MKQNRAKRRTKETTGEKGRHQGEKKGEDPQKEEVAGSFRIEGKKEVGQTDK